ncbi:MAG TPA: carboxypeptidase regulatory-like domain-containing protein, partial [Vicinamibacterales bacterium]|nr:carboxypeptidase regulatory-like domain-containing protein [Vicinamibacterales bacterium]
MALPTTAALAQTTTATVGGLVLDPQRLPVPRARVTVEDRLRGTRRMVESGEAGIFEIAGLQPGEYRLTVELDGFTTTQLDLRLEVNQRLRVDVTLQPKVVGEEIVVRQTTPMLDTVDPSVGQVIGEEQLSQLPLNGRQFLELALLVPGVHTSHGAGSGSSLPLYWRPGQNSAISVTGGRPSANAFRIDGTSNTDPSFNTYIVNLPPDAIREFQIETGSYSAELGSAGNGQVNVVTKAGTQELHGSLYDHLRNSAFDSRPFNNPDELPHFAQNQYGGTLGGPLFTRRTFFFGSFEGLRSAQGQSMMMTVPLAEWRVGDFSGAAPIYDPLTTRPNPNFDPTQPPGPQNPQVIRQQFPGNRIPLERIDPVALRVLREFVPLPNMDGGVNNYLDTRAQVLRNDQGTLRIDHVWDNGTSMFGRYTLSRERGFTPENLPGFGANHDNTLQSVTGTIIQPLSSRLLHELRFGYSRMQLNRLGEAANGEDLVSSLGIRGVGFGGPAAYGLPRFNVQGFDPIGDALLCTPCEYDNQLFQVGERLSWAAGSHSLRVGGDLRYFKWDMLGFFQNRGYFQFTPGFTARTASNDGTGQALASFLLGLPVLAQRQAGLPSMNMRQTGYELFVQDDWRVGTHLTINAGLRYEYATPLRDVKKILTNLIWIDGKPFAYAGGQAGYPDGLAYPDRNNFAPRIGFSFNPHGGHYVIRAGYGGFYSYPEMNLWCNQVHNVPLVFPEIQASNPFIPSIFGLGFGTPVLGQTLVGFTAIDPHWQIPYIQQASASLERQFGDSLVIEVGYIGAWGRNLDRARLVNNAEPSPLPLGPRRPYRTISFVEGTQLPDDWPIVSMTFPVGPINLLEFTARSEYNAGYVQATRRFGDGLQFLASYTYSKSMSDSPSFRSAAMEPEVPQDSYNLAAEWGPGGCDIRHRLVASLVYQIPFSSRAQTPATSGWRRLARALFGDWQVAVIHQTQSGFPFTISVFGDTANAGSLLNINPVRANVVPGVSPYLPSSQRTTDRWFNTDAFVTPPAFTFGNAGRNSLYGPWLWKTDLAFQREFAVRGDARLEFRAE